MMNRWPTMARYGTHVTILIWFATVLVCIYIYTNIYIYIYLYIYIYIHRCIMMYICRCKSIGPVFLTAEHEAASYVDQLQQEVEQEERDRLSVNCNHLPCLEHYGTLES